MAIILGENDVKYFFGGCFGKTNNTESNTHKIILSRLMLTHMHAQLQ